MGNLQSPLKKKSFSFPWPVLTWLLFIAVMQVSPSLPIDPFSTIHHQPVEPFPFIFVQAAVLLLALAHSLLPIKDRYDYSELSQCLVILAALLMLFPTVSFLLSFLLAGYLSTTLITIAVLVIITYFVKAIFAKT